MGWGREGRETLVRVGYGLNSAGRGGGGAVPMGASYQVRLQSVHERDKAAAGRRETHNSCVIQVPQPPPLPWHRSSCLISCSTRSTESLSMGVFMEMGPPLLLSFLPGCFLCVWTALVSADWQYEGKSSLSLLWYMSIYAPTMHHLYHFSFVVISYLLHCLFPNINSAFSLTYFF